jgi:hypothetical protein
LVTSWQKTSFPEIWTVCLRKSSLDPLDDGALVADIYAVRSRSEESAVSTDSPGRSDQKPHRRDSTTLGPRETLVVEVETGFVPPEAALAPIRYRQARIAAKIARYSGHSQRFALATPGYHVLQVPEVLLQPPDERKKKELKIHRNGLACSDCT